jgi:hypothetical protein
MKDLNKIAGFNILFIFAYAMVLRFAFGKETQLMASVYLVPTQVVVNLIISIAFYAAKETQLGNSYLLTTFLVLIVGFGVCLTTFSH